MVSILSVSILSGGWDGVGGWVGGSSPCRVAVGLGRAFDRLGCGRVGRVGSCRSGRGQHVAITSSRFYGGPDKYI